MRAPTLLAAASTLVLCAASPAPSPRSEPPAPAQAAAPPAQPMPGAGPKRELRPPEPPPADHPQVAAKAARPAEPGPASLVSKHWGKLLVKASSVYPGWPATRAVDGDRASSWFSATGDCAARGKRPWLELVFPEDVTVSRVVLVGNREPPWQQGYSIIAAEFELRDAHGDLLRKLSNESPGKTNDIEIRASPAVERVRSIRFTSLADEGSKNPYLDVAIGEIEVY